MKHLFLASAIGWHGVIEKIIERIPREQRKLVFITTASEVEEGEKLWFIRDRQALVDAGFDVTDYTVTGKSAEEVHEFLSAFDVLCVEGGNTYYLLQELRRNGADEALKELIEAGKIYIGSSAGSIVLCPTIEWTGALDDPKSAPDLTSMSGLGLVNFLLFPHWGADKRLTRHLEHNVPLLQKQKYPIVLLADSQCVHVQDDSLQFIDASPVNC